MTFSRKKIIISLFEIKEKNKLFPQLKNENTGLDRKRMEKWANFQVSDWSISAFRNERNRKVEECVKRKEKGHTINGRK